MTATTACSVVATSTTGVVVVVVVVVVRSSSGTSATSARALPRSGTIVAEPSESGSVVSSGVIGVPRVCATYGGRGTSRGASWFVLVEPCAPGSMHYAGKTSRATGRLM